ncbi:MAG: replicative DNA helicase [Myxococcales bacterium]|nr:MAG: replicative DNA helicase [Myxococcales bacterium]
MALDPSLQRVPPHSVDAEQAVLGGVLLDARSVNEVMELVHPEDFYLESHRCIYQAIAELSNHAEPIDLVTLKDRLEKLGKLETAGGVEYLSELASRVPTAAHARSYARLIKEKSLLRRAIAAGLDIVGEGFDDPPDIEEYLDQAEKKIFEVTQDKIERPFFPIRELVSEAFKRIETLDAQKGGVSGVPTGFHDLDRMTSGLQPAELIIVAARPSMGKTSLALNIALTAALEQKLSVGIFSLEMSRQELVIRMMCTLAKVDSQKFRTGHLDDKEWMRLVDAADRLNETRVYIDDTAALTVVALRSKARRMKMLHGLDMVIVDYLQLMQGSLGRKREASREQEISDISRSLKGLAKELEIPVMGLSQLNRDLEKRQDKRPQMSDLRESGAIEQDADVILFIYRDIVYNPENTDKENLAEILLSKQRSGPTGKVELRYTREFTLFENYISDEDADSYFN